MAISATPDDSPPASSSLIYPYERDLQPFFVLHRATPPQKSSGPVKTSRKIDLSSSEEAVLDENCKRLQIETFDFVWSRIEATIKDVLRNINDSVFDEIHPWVRASFGNIKSRGFPSFAQATRSCPISTDAASRQLFAGDLPSSSIHESVKNWLIVTEDIIEINDKVNELQSALEIDKSSNQSSTDISKCTLAQEYGGAINLHEWYQSFKAILCLPSTKVRSRPKYSPSPKKRKDFLLPLLTSLVMPVLQTMYRSRDKLIL